MFKVSSIQFNRGTGLGNKLFPWARCVIFSEENKLKMLWPNFTQIRKAPFIKGGIDYKTSLGKILLLKNFKNDGSYIGGISKIIINLKKRKKQIDLGYKINRDETANFVFRNDTGFFTPLHDHVDLVYQELIKITHPEILDKINNYDIAPIILNIRRGKDFSDAKSDADFQTKGLLRTPLYWFRETLQIIRDTTNANIPALIISDGNQYDLRELLSIGNVQIAKTKCALEDLLLLAKAKVIIGSGGSSFSAWGSFLSKAPTLTIPGQSLQWFNVSNDLEKHLVTTFDVDFPDQKILKIINDKLEAISG